MTSVRRKSVTESFESTRIVLRPGTSFRFCNECERCGTVVRESNDLTRLTLEEILISGQFRISGIDRGTLVLCSATTSE